jgi:LPXTG-motif cell wall-anchored protein
MDASDITSAITTLTSAFSDITGWFPIIIAIGFFVAGTAISLIAGFFGKKRRKRR